MQEERIKYYPQVKRDTALSIVNHMYLLTEQNPII